MAPPDPALEQARAHYERIAERYGTPEDDGLFHWVRRREIGAILRFLRVRPGDRILDAGCGPGHIARLLRDAGARVVGVDVSPRMLAMAQPWLEEARCAAIESLALGERFAGVLCAGALEFTAAQRATFDALARHLAPGGRLVVLFPVANLGGQPYRLVQARRGMSVHLLKVGTLERWAREHGLRRVGSFRPFFHGQVLAFERPAAGQDGAAV